MRTATRDAESRPCNRAFVRAVNGTTAQPPISFLTFWISASRPSVLP
jgi:hypothetical protein